MDPTVVPMEITPFRIDVPQAELDDLARRLDHTRWPDEKPGTGRTFGAPLDDVRALAGHWRDGYDWRAQEARLNAFPQFTTEIDGDTVHFLHVRSAEPGALPLVLTHGWPGSVVEFLDVIGPLTDPVAHGGDAADAFHVVVPTIPGFGFGGPVSGRTAESVAPLWAELMRRLGHDRYAAHGGDFGAVISRELGVVDPQHCAALHLTQIMSATVTAETADMSDPAERRAVEQGYRYTSELGGYAQIQGTRPQTLAFGLSDSPVGLLAWIADAFLEWSAPDAVLDRDLLLTNVMIYWLNGTAASAARYYREGAASWGSSDTPSTVPTAVAVLPHDIGSPVRRIAERTTAITRWTELADGGHFGALEQPAAIVDDLRAALRPHR